MSAAETRYCVGCGTLYPADRYRHHDHCPVAAGRSDAVRAQRAHDRTAPTPISEVVRAVMVDLIDRAHPHNEPARAGGDTDR